MDDNNDGDRDDVDVEDFVAASGMIADEGLDANNSDDVDDDDFGEHVDVSAWLK